jgi:outer membrane protein
VKYLPWGLVGLLALALVWFFLAAPEAEGVGTVNLTRIVEESARAKELNQMLSDRFDELLTRFDLESEPDEEDVDRANRERQAYSEYLAYRLELETQFQAEVDAAVREVAEGEKVKVVLDEDMVRYGGKDLTNEVIKRLD